MSSTPTEHDMTDTLPVAADAAKHDDGTDKTRTIAPPSYATPEVDIEHKSERGPGEAVEAAPEDGGDASTQGEQDHGEQANGNGTGAAENEAPIVDAPYQEEGQTEQEASPAEDNADSPIPASTVTAPGTTAQDRAGESAKEVPARAVARANTRRAHLYFPLPRLIVYALLFLLLVSILAPLSFAVSYGMNAYTTYNTIKAHANSGLQHLLNVKTLYANTKNNPNALLATSRLAQARREFTAARSDFVQVQSLLDHTSIVQTVSQYMPQYRPQITAARTASQIGIDVSDIGLQVVSAATVLAPRLRGPLLVDSHAPLVTSSDITLIDQAIGKVLPLLDDIIAQGQHLSLNALPINSHSKEQFQQYLHLLPQARSTLVMGRSLLGAAGWLLGVDKARTFLVQTMDRAELRATGGFTGQYGELHVQNGRVAPFSLRDISFVEYSDNSPTSGNMAPVAYRSWWPFANWGMRDSNLSADFPTSAKITMNQYHLETKRSVDGVILFTPNLIEHILGVLGPLHIARYNEMITAQNLEQRLHYYQLDNSGIRKSEIVEHVEDPNQARKLFTSEVARTLMEQIRHAPPSLVASLGLSLLHDLKTKDLQVYMDNAQVEDLLTRYDYAGAMDRSLGHDGLYIVQANVSASKASQYVQTVVKDTVNLDARGGATHTMQLRLVYSQEGPVYGLDTYRDYVRIYVPPQAKFLYGDGFDTGRPLCGGPLAACPSNGVYPRQELVCPTGQYIAGATAPTLGDPYVGQWHPLDSVGPPTNFHSDEPQRAMFGGYVIVPKNCTMTITLSWYVPPLGSGSYSLLLQRQATTAASMDVTIVPPVAECASLKSPGATFHGPLDDENVLLSLHTTHSQPNQSPSCYPSSPI